MPRSVLAGIEATRTGRPVWTGQRRVDPTGTPGTVEVVVAKSDAAALGLHGIAVRRVLPDGSGSPLEVVTFLDPQSPRTRLTAMEIVGKHLAAARAEVTSGRVPDPVALHLVLPDAITGDVLVSIADSLAGIETARLRWQRDIEQGREPLTFDGQPAEVPDPLTEHQRLAVSFLLEEDRARAMTLRWPLVDLRAVLARHVVAGGPAFDSGRLDYLVTWAEATGPLDHRQVSDQIAASLHTPGARLSNLQSDAIHRARTRDPHRYRAMVEEELAYKAHTMERAIAVLGRVVDSKLRDVHRAIEADAQEVWLRRVALHASDLVRFGRTSWVWRNSQVELRDTDTKCSTQLQALGNPQFAEDLARNAGTREVALATVTSVRPLRLEVRSRRLGHEKAIVALHVNGEPCIEASTVTINHQKGSFKVQGVPLGRLAADDQTEADGSLQWLCTLPPSVAEGDVLVVADAEWFGKVLTNGRDIKIDRPKADTQSAPRPDCTAGAYEADPDEHRWCCRSHESAEAEYADELAARRARGEMNPDVWPPIVDEDGFDTPGVGTPTVVTESGQDTEPVPADLTIDDVD